MVGDHVSPKHLPLSVLMETRERRTAVAVATGLILGALLLCTVSCSPPEPYKIGYLGSLAGSLGAFTIAGRNGVILAVEEINRQGGISGRPVTLLIKNDQGGPEAGAQVVKSFADDGVAVVIGPLLGEISRFTGPLFQKEGIAMISLFTDNADVSIQGNFLFSLYPSGQDEAHRLADLAYNGRDYRQVTVLYDLTDREYAENRIFHFKKSFEDFGGTIIGVTSYTTRDDTDFGLLATQLSENDPDAVLVLAEPRDIAHLCGQFKRQQRTLPVLTTGWSATPELIREGGTATEGVELFQAYDFSSRAATYRNFLREYQDRFHEEPEMGALYGYDAARIVLTVLEQKDDKHLLGDGIAGIRLFEGLQGPVEFDHNNQAKLLLLHKRVQNGALVTVNQE